MSKNCINTGMLYKGGGGTNGYNYGEQDDSSNVS